jgi:hypothetical protein
MFEVYAGNLKEFKDNSAASNKLQYMKSYSSQFVIPSTEIDRS